MNVGIQLQKIPHNSENISTNSRLKLLTPSKIRQVAAREFNGQVVISPIANNSLIGQNVDSAEVPEQTASAEQPVQSASLSTTDQTSVPVVETFLHPSAAYKSGRLTGKVQTDGVVSNLTANFSAAPRLSGHKNSSGQAVTQPLPSSSTSLAGGFSRCSKKLPQLPSLKTSKTKSAQGFTPPCLESIPKKGNKHQFHANLVSIYFLILGSKVSIPFSETFPLQIHGLDKKKGNPSDKKKGLNPLDLMFKLRLEKLSLAVCGVCSVQRRSEQDPAFR